MKAVSLLSGLIIAALLFSCVGTLTATKVLAAPSGQIEVEAQNVLLLGDTEEVTVTFRNTASADLDDVASTIQFIALAAADLNPTRTLIALDASWEIYVSESDPSPRVSGTVTGTLDTTAIYAPYSTSDSVYLYSWGLGKPSDTLDTYTDNSQFENGLKILRPGEVLKLTVTIECQDVVGDARLWFFFRATEFEPATVPIGDIGTIPQTDRMNLYYSKAPRLGQTPYWWPLHNSYDPYDPDIDTGHNFDQLSWTRGATTTAFAKSNKVVHQKPRENVPQPCIEIIKDGPAEAVEGETITYEFTLTNCGNVALTNVTVTDPVLKPVPPNADSVIWGPDTLGVGESVDFTFPYTIPGDASDPLVNTATATGYYDATPVDDSDGHSVDILETGEETPCIDIIKEGPAQAVEGETITYEFTVTNCGNVALANVTVTDTVLGTVPAPPAPTTLAVGESVSFTQTYTVPDPFTGDPPLVNTATATGYYDDTPVDDLDGHSVEIARTFSFHICGVKFEDVNRNGIYDVETEQGIDGVTVILLGPDGQTPAEDYYAGLSYPANEDNPLLSGENQLTGSYCFNLVHVPSGTYTFYIGEEVPPGWFATTPSLIGPITLQASIDGPRESIRNHFGNAKPIPVGGEVYPVPVNDAVNKVGDLLLWLALGLLFIASIGGVLVLKGLRAR